MTNKNPGSKPKPLLQYEIPFKKDEGLLIRGTFPEDGSLPAGFTMLLTLETDTGLLKNSFYTTGDDLKKLKEDPDYQCQTLLLRSRDYSECPPKTRIYSFLVMGKLTESFDLKKVQLGCRLFFLGSATGELSTLENGYL